MSGHARLSSIEGSKGMPNLHALKIIMGMNVHEWLLWFPPASAKSLQDSQLKFLSCGALRKGRRGRGHKAVDTDTTSSPIRCDASENGLLTRMYQVEELSVLLFGVLISSH